MHLLAVIVIANESPVYPGIGGRAAVIGRAAAVNTAKDEPRERCKKIQNVRVSVPIKDGKGDQVVNMRPLVRVILRELQHSDLNLLAACRKVPILNGRVGRVACIRARTRSVYRKTRAEIARCSTASTGRASRRIGRACSG